MADHSLPTSSSTYANFVSQMSARFNDLAAMMDPAVTTPTNMPTNSVRWNSANNRFEKYNGTAWVVLSSTFAFTDLSASGTVTLSGGTANGVPYLNATKVLSTTSGFVFDGTNLGIGVSPTQRLDVAGGGRFYAAAGNSPLAYWWSGGGYRLTVGITDTASGVAIYNTLDGNAQTWQIASSEAMRLTSTGLGIGTTAPGAKVHAVGATGYIGWISNSNAGTTGLFNTNPALVLQNLNATNENNVGIGFYDSTSAVVAEIRAIFHDHTNHKASLAFGTRNNATFAEYMRLDFAGNLGLGTTSPNFGGYSTAANTVLTVAGKTTYGAIELANVAALSDGKTLGQINFVNTTQGNTDKSSAIITARQRGADATNPGSDLAFYTRTNAGSLVERFTLDAAGNAGLGVTPSAWSTAASSKALEFSHISLYANAGSGGVYYNAYLNSTANWVYKNTGAIFASVMAGTGFFWKYAASGTAGTTATPTDLMLLDTNGNLGLAVTPSAWGGVFKALEMGGGSFYSDGSTQASIASNAYNSSGWKYKASAAASLYANIQGQHQWFIAAPGTAGNAITFTQALTLFNSGGLALGSTTDPGAGNLSVSGTVADGTSVIRPLVQGTSVTLNSAIAADFTSIPSWARRITISFYNVSTSSTDNLMVRLGTSSSVVSTGYLSQVNTFNNAPGGVSTGGAIMLTNNNAAAYAWSGTVHLEMIGSNIWVASGVCMTSAANATSIFAGGLGMSGPLTRVQFLTQFTGTFDSGIVNILYE